MARSGPIIIIEDDIDDQDLMREVFQKIGVPNELLVFDTCEAAYDFLCSSDVKPFIIFSDINLPGMTGPELKKKINEDARLRRKSIPYVFLTTTSAHAAVLEAYENLAQGFFTKPHDIRSLQQMIEMILNYWKIARHPNPNLL